MSVYPGTLDTFSTKVDKVDLYLAADMNAVQASIVAVETELGTEPAGSQTDVKTRLAVSLNNDGTLKPIRMTHLLPLAVLLCDWDEDIGATHYPDPVTSAPPLDARKLVYTTANYVSGVGIRFILPSDYSSAIRVKLEVSVEDISPVEFRCHLNQQDVIKSSSSETPETLTWNESEFDGFSISGGDPLTILFHCVTDPDGGMVNLFSAEFSYLASPSGT